jgi:hypothetical protein
MSNTDLAFTSYLLRARPFIEAILEQRCTKEQAEQVFVESMKRKGSTESEEYLKQMFVEGFRFERNFRLSPKATPLIKALSQKSLTQQEAEEAFIRSARGMGFTDTAEELIEVFKHEKRRTRTNGYLAGQATPYVRAFLAKECTEQEARQAFIQYMQEQGDSDPDEDLNRAFGMACYYESK